MVSLSLDAGQINGTYRGGVVRIIGAGYWYWRKERQHMKPKITYTNEPLGDIEVVADFLPPPGELAFREGGIKVTLALSKKSVEFFKLEAARHQTQYQRMIRRLLDAYVEAQEARPITGRASRVSRKRAAV